jgi:hypothetical protein
MQTADPHRQLDKQDTADEAHHQREFPRIVADAASFRTVNSVDSYAGAQREYRQRGEHSGMIDGIAHGYRATTDRRDYQCYAESEQ